MTIIRSSLFTLIIGANTWSKIAINIDFFAHWLKSLTIEEFAQSGEYPAKWRWKPGEDFLLQLSELSYQPLFNPEPGYWSEKAW
jgi:hypothetical protein